MIDEEKFIRLAIEEALDAGRMGEVPIGAVITDASKNVISSLMKTWLFMLLFWFVE